MSRYTRSTGSKANDRNAPDMRTMFTTFMREILRDVQGEAPNAANGGGAVAQVPETISPSSTRIVLVIVGSRSMERNRLRRFKIGLIVVSASLRIWESRMQ